MTPTARSIKTCQAMRLTEGPPAATQFLPVTMTVDDELTRLRGMVSDLRRLNEDFAAQYDQHARVKAERDDLRRENEALRAALAKAER